MGEHKKERGDFLAIPVVKTSPSSEEGAGSTSGQRTKISFALRPKKSNSATNSIKTLKLVHIEKNLKSK